MCFSCVCFVRISCCHFSLPLGVRGWLRFVTFLLTFLKDIDLSRFSFLLGLNTHSTVSYSCSKFVIIRWCIALKCKLLSVFSSWLS